MPSVLVRYYANLRDVVKRKEEVISGATDLQGLISILVSRYGEAFRRWLFRDGSLMGNVIILVNGRNVLFGDKLATALNEGDQVDIFPPVAGG
ncbi:MAG: ubiquitin-like small modifier protein 1 [Thermoplasmata archaeon]